MVAGARPLIPVVSGHYRPGSFVVCLDSVLADLPLGGVVESAASVRFWILN